MITCPFCRTALAETAPSCPRCQLDLQRATATLGPPPILSPSGVTDFCGALAPEEERTLARRALAFHRQFPQCRLLIVIRDFAPQVPLAVHLFWLFNSSGLPGGELTHGRNRDVLIGLDPKAHLAGLTVGYGLEPFLPQTALERAVDCGSPQLKAGETVAGLLTIIDRLSSLMEGICGDLPDLLGLDRQLVVRPSSRTEY